MHVLQCSRSAHGAGINHQVMEFSLVLHCRSINEQGHTPLHVACIAGKSYVVQVPICSVLYVPMLARASLFVQMYAQVLRLFGAELLAETPTSYTAMHFPTTYGNLECLKVCLWMLVHGMTSSPALLSHLQI